MFSFVFVYAIPVGVGEMKIQKKKKKNSGVLGEYESVSALVVFSMHPSIYFEIQETFFLLYLFKRILSQHWINKVHCVFISFRNSYLKSIFLGVLLCQSVAVLVSLPANWIVYVPSKFCFVQKYSVVLLPQVQNTCS